MFCLLNIDHYVIPNDIVVKLSKIYRYIGNNDFYLNSLGSDLNKVIDLTVEKDAYFLAKILKLDISEARAKLIITKDSSPRNKEEMTLSNLKELLSGIQQKYHTLRLQSNDIYNMINYVYSQYSAIKFSMYEGEGSVLQSQNLKSKRLILDEMYAIIEKYTSRQLYERIILYIHYFIDLFNLNPFESRNTTISWLILYQLVLTADINAFKYVSFFEIIYYNYKDFTSELCKASVNWNEGYSQTTEFVRYFLNLIENAYKNTDQIIKNYQYDKTNKKYENIESSIMSMKTIFTKDEIRQMYPYVSESTINRVLVSLRDAGLIEPLGKGRSAKWTRK